MLLPLVFQSYPAEVKGRPLVWFFRDPIYQTSRGFGVWKPREMYNNMIQTGGGSSKKTDYI